MLIQAGPTFWVRISVVCWYALRLSGDDPAGLLREIRLRAPKLFSRIRHRSTLDLISTQSESLG